MGGGGVLHVKKERGVMVIYRTSCLTQVSIQVSILEKVS